MHLKVVLDLLVCITTLIGASLSLLESQPYYIYDIIAKNVKERKFLEKFVHDEKYDFFILPKKPNETTRVRVGPHDRTEFEWILNSSNIDYTPVKVTNSKFMPTPGNGEEFLHSAAPSISFTTFHSFSTISNYLDKLSETYPDWVKVKTMGISYEGRQLKYIHLHIPKEGHYKKVIVVDAGIHAREWIGPAAALYIVQQLVDDSTLRNCLLENYSFVIVPVVNPDGYEYSRNTDRLWVKTRKPFNSQCIGIDVNRNFGFSWELGSNVSSNPCSNTYKGKVRFSEPESLSLKNVFLTFNNRTRIKFYLSLHSYGNYLLFPFTYDGTPPSHRVALEEVANAGANAIKQSTGTVYTVGSALHTLNGGAGGSTFFAYDSAKIPIAISMRLPAGGESGFDPPPSDILNIVSETWTGVKAMFEKVISKY